MAKKTKVSSKKNAISPVEYSPSMYVDFDDIAEVKGVSVGDEIRLLVRGKVRGVEQRAMEDNGVRASICLADFEAEIVPNSTEFDSLLDDEDD